MLTFLLGLPGLFWPAATFDEQVLLVDPLRMNEGDLPFRDFATAYGPVHWWLLQGLYALTTVSVLGERVLGLIVHVCLTIGWYRLLRPHGPGPALCGAAIAAVLLLPLGDAPYAWITACTLCVWALALLGKPHKQPVLLVGVLQALAIGVRPDAALLAVVPALPLLRTHGNWRRWSVGLTIGGVPLLVMAVATRGAMLRDVLVDRAGRAARQSSLPLWPEGTAERLLLCLVLLSILLLVVWVAQSRTPAVAALTLLAVFALPAAAQRTDSTHLVYAALICLPLLPAATTYLLSSLVAPQRLLGHLGLTLAVLVGTGELVLRPLVLTLAGKSPPAVKVRHHGRELALLPGQAGALRALLEELDRVAPPGSRLFVYDSDLTRPAVTDLAVYYLSPRLRQDAHTIDVTPGVSNAEDSPLADDVARADVLVLVDSRTAVREALFPREIDGSRAASSVLMAKFVQTSVIYQYQVWVRRN